MLWIKRTWKLLFSEPLAWIRCCFFQPERFNEELEPPSMARRFLHMCRLAIIIFVLSYPITLLVRALLIFTLPTVYSLQEPATASPFFFVFDPMWAAGLGILVGMLVGTMFGVRSGIALGLGGVIWAGTIVGTSITNAGYVVVLSASLLFDGLIFGVTLGSAKDSRLSSRGRAATGHLLGILFAYVLGIPVGALGGYGGGIWAHEYVPVLWNIPVARSILGGLPGVLLAGLVALIAIGIVRGTVSSRYDIIVERALSTGTAFCIGAGAIAGSALGTVAVITQATDFTSYIRASLPAALVAAACFMFGYFRIPLYPISGFSTYRAYRASRQQPTRVFEYLHQSALYWDERVYSHLPGLTRMLLLATTQDVTRTLQEIKFIVTERPSQRAQVYVVTLEIVLSELEGCESLKQVSRTARRLGEILPHEAGLIDQRWVPPFTKLYEASLEAGRYSTSPGRQSQRDALNDMIDKLRQIYPRIAFDDANMNKRLQEIVKKWTQLAQQGLDKLGQFPEEAGYIENPYICGSALKPNNRLFVGRRTLVQQLEQALNRENQRLHIFLTGERRMGKTSTLNHLSTLLSTRYLPIILDLQSPDILSSTAAFLSKLANAIYTTMDARGARIRRLEHAFLQEAGRENEASCYHLFNEWLKDVEALLERNDQTLLIAFDEFEKLEMAGREHYLSLALLLNWIRSVIQNHSRMALLFSGVRTLADVNPDWPGYFVNVKTLKVTLLTPDDARTLITQPLPGFRGEDIFGEEGVDEIIRVSGCHPFLVQAICDELIETLNVERRKRACHADVMTAVENVLQSWSAYFQDLWVRTSAPQQACLIALKCLGRATISQIAQQCAFNEQKVQQTLQELQWRDLVLVENGCYRIAIPVFASWLHV